MAWTMPHEADPHERTWMAWPSRGYTLGDTAADAEEARAAWTAVAHAVARFEPVTMAVDPIAEREATQWLGDDVALLTVPLDDAWMRDIGPTFVRDGAAIAAVDWEFNGWGAQDWAAWDRDRLVAARVAVAAGAPRIPSPLVNEGGGIHVDGTGTVLVTRTVQLDPGRNPGWSEADVEAELARTIGATRVVWLPRGLTRDSDRYGTRGHVDLVAAFARPGVVLVHDQRDPAHPDATVSRAAIEQLTDEGFEVLRLPAPAALRDGDGWVDHSYVNHLVVNGGVIACGFGDPQADDRAAGVLRDAYPGRQVVTVDARPIFARGGGIHCITQQQPAGKA